jgi:hypothetical protein
VQSIAPQPANDNNAAIRSAAAVDDLNRAGISVLR